jgi:hypothetical protein
MLRQSGSLARALCADAHSTNTATISFMQIPLSQHFVRIRPSALRHYFFLPELKLGCHPAVFWLGAAAIVLIFSFFGFLASRLPFCSPLAICIPFCF